MSAPAQHDLMPHDDGALAYWEDRHRATAGLRSGGHIGVTAAGNEAFYAIRLGLLLAAVGDLDAADAPLQILDAGCGKGYFARGLVRCGHAVDAVDASESAISAARAAGGGPRYSVGELASWRRPYCYDAIVAVDVLFHIVSAEMWALTLLRLASMVAYGGRLVLSDRAEEEQRRLGGYIVHRPRSQYAAVLEPRGFRYGDWRPYGFRDSAVGFHTWIRSR